MPGLQPVKILPSLIPKPATFFNRSLGKHSCLMPVGNMVWRLGHDLWRFQPAKALAFAHAVILHKVSEVEAASKVLSVAQASEKTADILHAIEGGMDESRRQDVRRNFFTQGRIVHPKAIIDCTLHNISAAGALVSVDTAQDLPKAFILQIPGNLEIRRRCVLAWRDGEWVGMKFVTREKRRRDFAPI